MLNLTAIFLIYTKRNPATSHNLFNTFLSAITTDVFLVQPTAIPMAYSPDHDDTQVVDSPPPDTVLFDDETQLVDDYYDLYGETQVMEEDDGVVRSAESKSGSRCRPLTTSRKPRSWTTTMTYLRRK
ncbi:hypothetical protein M6B38_171940 [Iris pallida]|uniref:Uncharacterized protein n=1 Tax=Iris pallida TaxID=29817 RepID=A0AAX6EUW3_IRIPA|nr:hypothetical protein M6B38_171940 [Iris pallida]